MRTAWAERERQIGEGGIGERKPWQDRFIAGLQSILPDTEILGRRVSRLWNTVSFLIRPMAERRRRWVVRLDKLGFAVSTGSACASGKEQPSHVLLAMGYDPAKVGQMLRVSSGWETSEDDWHALLDAIKMCARER
jgi:cysteine desulfurase